MKKAFLILALVTTILISCKKETFPEVDDLSGSWIEQTDRSYKYKLIFDEETLIFIKPSSRDTFSYQLDNKQDRIFLTSPAGESNHKISLHQKSEITIWGLFPSIPENESETKFVKE